MTRRRRLGLVLSGGGIRGAAHIGVFRALDEAGLRPDLIVGVSIGAAAGAAYACGISTARMRELFSFVRWPRINEFAFGGGLGFLRRTPLDDFLRHAIEPRTFADMNPVLAVVATDIAGGEAVVLEHGSVAEAIRASAALPGFFPPVERDGRVLIDGGVLANLPVWAARDRGAEVVVAVDILPPPDNRRPPRSPIDILLMASSLRCRLTHPDPSTVDCYVMPDLADLSWSKVSEVPEMERRGYEAMRARTEDLAARLTA